MSKPQLKHMVVILPGIMGSVLRKDGRDVWAFSASAITDAVFRRADWRRHLELTAPDDPALDDLGDGVEATDLISDGGLIPGFMKFFHGYRELGDMIRRRFDVQGAGLASKYASNLFEVPYDWRRDNRVSARKLARLVDERLDQWRKYTGDNEAKVIVLAHSMGGIVARHYLEVMDGWRNCLALVTLGTPYRGSIQSVNFLANGYKKLMWDLTACLRSFTSVYQLLPTYPVIQVAGEFSAVADRDDIPGIERGRAQAAAAFHAEIARTVEAHRTDAVYLVEGYKTLPFVGTRQRTLQSAVLDAGTLTANEGLPHAVHELLGMGDGTVPRFSAMPPEMANEFRETFVPEQHGALQCSEIVLNDVLGRLEQMQVPRTRKIRGSVAQPEGAAISLDVDDVYAAEDDVRLVARVLGEGPQAGGVVGLVSRVGTETGAPLQVAFGRANGHWEACVPGLPAGLYRIEVQTDRPYPLGPPPVHDVFAVD